MTPDAMTPDEFVVAANLDINFVTVSTNRALLFDIHIEGMVTHTVKIVTWHRFTTGF